MGIFSQAAGSANQRDRERIEKAETAKNSDKAKIKQQKNIPYEDRLVRASLQGTIALQKIDPLFKALVVASPEVLLHKAYQLGWGAVRKQKKPEQSAPSLLQEYEKNICGADFSISGADALELEIASGQINSTLVCHGLSPTPDSIFLLADLGRASRVAHAAALPKIEIMLADVTWMRYNRSLLNRFDDEDQYLDNLRVCQDKRCRLYQALGLEYNVFSISPFREEGQTIDEDNLTRTSELYIDLAKAIWGERILEPHDSAVQRMIGQTLNGLNASQLRQFPDHMQAMLKFAPFAKAFESEMKGELQILRSMSSLFSSFSHDIFVYYFAQFYAQRDFEKFLKVAVVSEGKFDSYFDEHANSFATFGSRMKSGSKVNPNTGKSKEAANRRYAYYPQYSMAGKRVLPYTSLSLDFANSKEDHQVQHEKLILLNDCGSDRDGHIDKITTCLSACSLTERNRLLSDLFSFTHLLVRTAGRKQKNGIELSSAISALSEDAAEEIFSENLKLSDYQDLFSNWLSAMEQPDSVLPFHLRPYAWDEDKWDDDFIRLVSNFIIELLTSVRQICT